MFIIEKEDLDLYRYSVAKVIFLKAYQTEYSLIENIYDSNCLFVKNINGGKLLISIFGKPNINTRSLDVPILVYYQKPQFKRYQNNKSLGIKMLNEYFDSLYNDDLSLAILSPHKFFEKYNEYGVLLEEIKINSSRFHDTTGTLYKYYSLAKVQNNSYNVNDGDISFLNPKFFNDPFDCSCVLSNNTSVSDNFRVLCTIQDEKNILMWSYYGSDHTGFCFEYSKHEIIKSIVSSNINGLCIIGKVNYSPKRPTYKSLSNKFSFTNIKFLIDCTFTKYFKWNHEDEYRFVLISENFNDNGDATKLNVQIKNILNGCKGNGITIKDSKSNILPYHKILMDSIDYKLN